MSRAVECDARRIRFVVERYEQLQGLRYVITGVSYVSVFGVFAAASAPGGLTGLLTALVGSVAVMVPGDLLVARYYRSRFGRVVRPPARPRSWWLLALIGAAIAFGDRLFDVGPLTPVWAIAGGSALWTAIADWPFRAHHLLGFAACSVVIGCLLVFRVEHHLGDAISFTMIGLAYIPIGLLDHRLLASVVRSRAVEAGLTTSAEATAVQKSCVTEERE